MAFLTSRAEAGISGNERRKTRRRGGGVSFAMERGGVSRDDTFVTGKKWNKGGRHGQK